MTILDWTKWIISLLLGGAGIGLIVFWLTKRKDKKTELLRRLEEVENEYQRLSQYLIYTFSPLLIVFVGKAEFAEVAQHTEKDSSTFFHRRDNQSAPKAVQEHFLIRRPVS